MAEELLELGRSAPALDRAYAAPRGRRPFLSDRPHLLGQFEALGKVGQFVTDAFGAGFGLLADLVDVPAGVLAGGVQEIFGSVANLLEQVPALGVLASQLVLLASAVIRFALSVPGMVLEGVSNVFEGLSLAIESAYSPDEGAEQRQKGASEILGRALDRGGVQLKDAVADLLGVPKDTPTDLPAPGEGTVPTPRASEEALSKWGIPLAVGGLVLLVLVS